MAAASSLFLPVPADRRPERFLRCVVGLICFGLGTAMFIASDLGAAPWDVFHQGVAEQLGWPLGVVIQVTGLLLVVLWFPLGLRPGWGTLMNALEVGLTVILVGPLLPEFEHFAPRFAYVLLALIIVGIGSGLYIGAGLGPGPRDGLMVAFAERGISVRLARTLIEAIVLVAGIALGGTVGVGTAVFALGIGPAVHFFLPRLTIRPAQSASGVVQAGTM